MEPRSRHTAQKGDAFCLLEMNVLWCEACKLISEQQQRTLWTCWRKQVQNIYIHSKTSPISTLTQHLKTSVRKLKLVLKWVFQMDNDDEHISKVVAKWLKDNKVKVLEWLPQSSVLNPIENLWAESVRARSPTNLIQLYWLCQEKWAKIHPTYCEKLVEGYPKCLTQVKQFKGNATKY